MTPREEWLYYQGFVMMEHWPYHVERVLAVNPAGD